MGIFSQIFGNKKPSKTILKQYFEGLTAYQPCFTSFTGGLYEAEITRDAIHAFATHCSKLVPVVKGPAAQNNVLAWRLKQKPNKWQTTSQWLYRTATILAAENNAFIVPLLEFESTGKERVVGYYTIAPSKCEVMEYEGEAWLRYQFVNGKVGAIELRRCAILNNFQYKDDFFGENNRALLPTLSLIHTQNQGIEEGIKAAASVRFLGRLSQTLKEKDIDAERKNFREKNFSVENEGGIVVVDNKFADIKQIISRPYIVDAAQMQHIEANVYNHFGVNDKILRSEWDEEIYTAFYESKIEPFAIQLGLGLTCMTYTEHERSFGNEVELTANRLQYATTATKLSVITNAVDRGFMSRNEARAIMQMPPIEGGDAYVIRGEYVNADQKVTQVSEGIEQTEE